MNHITRNATAPTQKRRGGMGNNNEFRHATASPSALLLPRLEGVVKTGKGWRARCPAHGGNSASLSIAEGDNGTLLVHCFASCTVHDVLAAVGLEVGDLYQRRDLKTMTPAERGQFRQAAMLPKWRAALSVLVTEANVVLLGAVHLSDNAPLDDTDLGRLRVATLRIFDAQEVLNAR